MTTTPQTTVDVRTIAPRDRHSLIFGTFSRLLPGEALMLLNDHDPKPLYDQFLAQYGGEFRWEYLESGPDVWRVRIDRIASCCA